MKKMTLTKLPHWTWNSSDDRDATWWMSLHQVQEHVKETGALPLFRSKLGSWLNYEKGKKVGNRTVEQKAALQDLLTTSKTWRSGKRTKYHTVEQKPVLKVLPASPELTKRKHKLSRDGELSP